LTSLVAHWSYIEEVSRTYDKLKSKYETSHDKRTLYKGFKKNESKLEMRNRSYRRVLSNLNASNQNIEEPLENPDKVEHLGDEFKDKKIVVKWKYLTLTEKFKLFDPWCIIIMGANMLQIIGVTSVLFSRTTALSFTELVIGLGCFGSWLGLLRFIDTNEKLYSAPKTIKTAVPVILRILIGVIPVLIGFSFLGMCLFWKSDKFKTPADAFFSLYSMMNGDVIRETYEDISFGKLIAASLFCYSFCFFAI